MNKDKLLKLADFLETKVVDCNFDLGYWQHVPEVKAAEHGDDPCKLLTSEKDFHCGYTACAMGWCPTIFHDFLETCEITNKLDFTSNKNEMAAYFGLNSYEFNYLFVPYDCSYIPEDYDESREGTVKRIREFVKSNTKE